MLAYRDIKVSITLKLVKYIKVKKRIIFASGFCLVAFLVLTTNPTDLSYGEETEESDNQERSDSDKPSFIDSSEEDEINAKLPEIPKIPDDLTDIDRRTGANALRAAEIVEQQRKLNIASMNKIPPMMQFPNYNRVMSISGTANSISRLQKQLDQIINLNEKLDKTNTENLTMIQKAVNVSKIHQKILDELAELEEKEDLTVDDTDEILRQEKIRLIKQQADENIEAFDEFSQESEESDSSDESGEGESGDDSQESE